VDLDDIGIEIWLIVVFDDCEKVVETGGDDIFGDE
jgi:hypothetical protein